MFGFFLSTIHAQLTKAQLQPPATNMHEMNILSTLHQYNVHPSNLHYSKLSGLSMNVMNVVPVYLRIIKKKESFYYSAGAI